MKKYMSGLLLAAVLLCGCSSGYKADIEDNVVEIEAAGLYVELPEDWSVYGSKDVYKAIYDRSGGVYDSVDDIKEEYEGEGQRCLALGESADAAIMCIVSVHDLTNEDAEEQAEPADYARTVHDSTIFEYLASGYRTGSDSYFDEGSEGGLDRWKSHFELFMPDENGDNEQFVLGQTEYLYSKGNDMYSVQFVYSQQDGRELTENVSVGIR